MTLLETERLVRKISELIQQTGNPEIAPKLAADYAAACHAANLRLQSCEAMIKAGDRPQAIQLAETAPNLLDLVTALEFRGSDEWRGHCQQNSLPIADRIDARSVQTLNQCYAQGITTDHPLYAAYRSAVLSRNDEEALKTLQSITRLNPADTNAASELERLDAKVLAVRLQHLGSSLEGAEPALLVAEIEAIEAFGFKNKPDGEAWRKAQAVRCECLLEETAMLKGDARWLDALAKIDFIHRLQQEFKVELPAAALKQLGNLETWARGEQEKDKKEREFQSLLGELHYRIHQSEEKDTSAHYVELPELRDDYEGMHKVWRSLTDFTRPIPEEAASSFRKRSALLEAEIARRTAIRRRVIFSSSAVILIVGAAIAWFVLGQMKAHNFSKQLQEAITQRQVHAADNLLERARNEKLGDANTIAAAETFSTREHALLANFETAFSNLPPQLTGEPNASRLAGIADQLSLARNAFNALAPDLKTENEPRLQAFENQWQSYLADSGAAVNGLYGQWISSAEKQCDGLDYRSPLDTTTKQLAALSDLVQKIQDCESGFGKNLQLRSDLLERSATVRGKFAAYNGELKKLDDGLAAMQKARTVNEFSDGIKLITSSEFTTSPAATAAFTVQSLDVSGETALRNLLDATNASTWAYIEKQQPVNFVPEVMMPAERQIFEQLNNDPAVNAIHQRYRLWLDSEGKAVDLITVGSIQVTSGSISQNTLTGKITEDGGNWNHIKAWTKSAFATSANFEDIDYTYFNGHFKMSQDETIYRVEQLDDLDETTSFHSVGLEKVWSGDAYSKPLLEVLDSIKDSREGSPLFRAYLYLRLMDLMNLQPDAWGITFCPAARMHEAQIKSIVGGPLESGDWFVAGKANSCGEKLEQFFDSVKSISYAKQANGLLTLARDASKSGLQYAGFVGLDGKPKLVDNSVSGEVFGYSAARKQPVLLAVKIDAGQPLKEPALPLSPLFTLDSPCKEYLTQAGVNPSDASFRDALPPLFQDTVQP
jgi:hypothetical protein